MNTPLILTVQFDETSQAFFNEKRKQYFPPERNFLSAHLTLFHHLPDDKSIITEAIKTVCSQQKQIELAITEVVSIGKGTAYKIESKALVALHKQLQNKWNDFLTPQDRQGLWPHVTIQNKVSPLESKQLLQQVKTEFVPFTAYAAGVTLWKYLNGPWQLYQSYSFAG